MRYRPIFLSWNAATNTLTVGINGVNISVDEYWSLDNLSVPSDTYGEPQPIQLKAFDLNNIDKMREAILQNPTGTLFQINNGSNSAAALEPYSDIDARIPIPDEADLYMLSRQFSQELLAVKTYQSDLFNNWISTEWIDGENGVNAITAIDTSSGEFTIDTLNLAQKVYVMLNRIAISGGSYDDWLDAVYTQNRTRQIQNPVYMGSLIRELAFEEVVSNAEASSDTTEQPLGTLAGRGAMTNKNKGGSIKIKVDEPSYIIGIVSLTPRVDYSQGNKWDVHLKTMNDFHKPALDGIGFQELITDQMAWQDTTIHQASGQEVITWKSAGKQPAWINYMTNYNRCYGNFAVRDHSMFMTLNRRYDVTKKGIEDLTTYIDPVKFNHIFAQTELDAQNFWVQISNNITTRRKMSAKIIPNL